MDDPKRFFTSKTIGFNSIVGGSGVAQVVSGDPGGWVNIGIGIVGVILRVLTKTGVMR